MIVGTIGTGTGAMRGRLGTVGPTGRMAMVVVSRVGVVLTGGIAPSFWFCNSADNAVTPLLA